MKSEMSPSHSSNYSQVFFCCFLAKNLPKFAKFCAFGQNLQGFGLLLFDFR